MSAFTRLTKQVLSVGVTGALDGKVPLIGMTDGALVRRTLDGDARAFTELVDRHAAACLRFAGRMLGDRADAEDVVQETFLRAFKALDSYDEQLPFRTWLFAILINRCRTAMSQRMRRERRLVLDNEALERSAVEATQDAVELREELNWAIAALSTEQREAFLLRHIEELSYEEIVAVTGGGVGTSALKMRVKRACERLQHLLTDGVRR